MKRWILPVLTLTLLTLPSLAQAQGQGRGGGGMMGGLMGQMNPVDLILSTADSLQLGLTEAEVTQVTAIRDELTETNAPHQTAVQGLLQRLQGGDMAAMQEIQQHIQPIQQANEAALARVRELLNEEQRTKVDAMLEARRPAGRMGGARGGGAFPG